MPAIVTRNVGSSGAVASEATVRLTPEALAAALFALSLHDRIRLAAMLLGQQPGQAEG
jgi:hypothetical protein